MLTKRQNDILALAVREYTDTGIPVSSRGLVRKYGLTISPATLRTEFARLCEMGYLAQPHTSAGRVPSEKGYRFYIKNLMRPEAVSREEKLKIRRELLQDTVHPGRSIARTISENTSSLGFHFDPEADTLYREGLPEVLQASEFKQINQIARFIELIDFLEHQIVEVFDALWDENEPTVLIGEDRLFPLSGDYSILYSGYRIGRNDYLIGALGPLRMNYARTTSILDFIRREILKDHGRRGE